MSDPFKNNGIPRAALVGAAFLIGLSLVATTAHVKWGFGSGVHGPGDVLVERSLVFLDQGKGSVGVRDFDSGKMIRTYSRDEGSFVRNLMRSLAKERLALGGSKDQPFTLIYREGGFLSLKDPITERTITLNAYGRDNVQAFANLLPPRPSTVTKGGHKDG